MIQTETALCGYCEELPEKGRAAAAHVNRCPLCKAELGITRSGRRFRIGADVPAPRGHIAIMAALACAGCVLVLVAGLATRSDPAVETVSLPAEPTSIVAARVTVVALQSPALPPDIAASKMYAEGVLSPEARVKPQADERGEASPGPDTTQSPPWLPPGPVLTVGKDLLAVPEVALEPADPKPATKVVKDQRFAKQELADARKRIADLVTRIDSKNNKEPDGFIRSLIEERSDLAGLSFQLGKACQLSSTDARFLRQASLDIRTALAESLKPSSTTKANSSAPAPLCKSRMPGWSGSSEATSVQLSASFVNGSTGSERT